MEMRISSTGHLAGVSVSAFPLDYLCVGTNRMCPDGICMSVSISGCLHVADDRQGVSLHTGRTRSAKNGVVVPVDEASALRIPFFMSSES